MIRTARQAFGTGPYYNGLPKEVDGVKVVGWARTDTSPSGRRYVGFDTWHVDVSIKLENGRRHLATVAESKSKGWWL